MIKRKEQKVTPVSSTDDIPTNILTRLYDKYEYLCEHDLILPNDNTGGK